MSRLRPSRSRSSHRRRAPRSSSLTVRPLPRKQATGKDWGNALKQGYREDGGLFCQSDDDEQLILTVPFRQIVNVTSVAIQGPADGTAPKTVKIFVNKPNLSFDNRGKKATATLADRRAGVASGEVIELDFTQFQNVRVVSFFVDDQPGRRRRHQRLQDRRQRNARAHDQHERAEEMLRRVKVLRPVGPRRIRESPPLARVRESTPRTRRRL